MQDPRINKLAESLVNYSCKVNKNENVLIKAEEKIKGNNTVIEQTVNQSSDENTESNTTTDETNTEDSNATEETTTQENTENSGTGNNSAE